MGDLRLPPPSPFAPLRTRGLYGTVKRVLSVPDVLDAQAGQFLSRSCVEAAKRYTARLACAFQCHEHAGQGFCLHVCLFLRMCLALAPSPSEMQAAQPSFVAGCNHAAGIIKDIMMRLSRECRRSIMLQVRPVSPLQPLRPLPLTCLCHAERALRHSLSAG